MVPTRKPQDSKATAPARYPSSSSATSGQANGIGPVLVKGAVSATSRQSVAVVKDFTEQSTKSQSAILSLAEIARELHDLLDKQLKSIYGRNFNDLNEVEIKAYHQRRRRILELRSALEALRKFK